MRIDPFLIFYYLAARLRAIIFSVLTGVKFKSVGCNFKYFGSKSIIVGKNFSLGDNCWIQAVTSYKGIFHAPKLVIGDNVSLSDSVHVSCVLAVEIGAGTLIGSNVYIGDHSHGPTSPSVLDLAVPPALRPLSDAAPIVIGSNVWIGDGARILAGSVIPNGSIVGANAVVKGTFVSAGVVVGIPAAMRRAF